VRLSFLTASDARPTWCEFKGEARSLDAIVTGHRAHAVTWSYPAPAAGYETLRDHVAFYPERLDVAWLDDERVRAQSGDFYGGWITVDLAGPVQRPGRQPRLVATPFVRSSPRSHKPRESPPGTRSKTPAVGLETGIVSWTFTLTMSTHGYMPGWGVRLLAARNRSRLQTRRRRES